MFTAWCPWAIWVLGFVVPPLVVMHSLLMYSMPPQLVTHRQHTICTPQPAILNDIHPTPVLNYPNSPIHPHTTLIRHTYHHTTPMSPTRSIPRAGR